MPTASQAEFAHSAILAALPADGVAPDWVTIFPTLGVVKTVDGRAFHVDAAALIAAFRDGGIDIPVDVNHAIDHKGAQGERADAVAWIKDLRVEGGALQGRVEWLDEGKALVAQKRYRYLSPAFYHTADEERRAIRLRALSLVNTPALGNQPALASSSPVKEPKMDKLSAALGVTTAADENAMLTALAAGFVPKKSYDEALAKLSASDAKLAQIDADGRKARVDALLEGALKGKKILPAEKDHYAKLCETDPGYESVKSLLAAKGAALTGSGLDDKKTPGGEGGRPVTAAHLAAQANKMVEAGEASDYLAALSILSDRQDKAAA